MLRRLKVINQPLEPTEQKVSRQIWMPLLGPQTLAYQSKADELFYGGAAGGGKSDLILGLSLTAHRHSLILRREATQLQALVERCRELISPDGNFRAVGHGGMAHTADGRSLEMAGCEHEENKRKYQGRPHDLKGFDELPQFSETQYLFVGGWNRSIDPRQRCRTVGGGNPPTDADGEWVLKRWAAWLDRQHPRPARPGELRWYAMVDKKEEERPDGVPFEWKTELIIPKSRTFVPALLSDNPILSATNYLATLQAFPEPLRSQLLHGDFTVGREDSPHQVIPTAWVLAAQKRWKADGGAGKLLDCLGVDVARGGKDKTVLAPRYGTWFAPLFRYGGEETDTGPKVAGKVLMLLDTPEKINCVINVDVIGVGSSAYDSLNSIEIVKLNVRPINFAEGSPGKDRAEVLSFANMRAYAYWAMREALDPVKGDNLALPPDPELLADLTAPRWLMRASGVLVEKKEDIVKRIGRSPDAGDAVVLANLIIKVPELKVWFYEPPNATIANPSANGVK